MSLEVAVYSTLNVDYGGGFERWLKEVTPRLRERGCKITIITTKAGERRENSSVRKHAEVVELENHKTLLVPKLVSLKEIIGLLKNKDVIYFNNAFAGNEVVLGAIRTVCPTPVCAGYHGTFPEVGGFVRRLYYASVNRSVSKSFDAHHVVNKHREKTLRCWGYKNVHLIPNGVNTHIFRPGKKEEIFTVVFIGRLTYQKGFDFFVDLVKTLNEKHSNDLRFIIVGDGPLSKTAQILQKFGNVEWFKRLTEEELVEVYQKAHVLVAPSRFEEFLLVSIEAQACGTPVIASDILGPRDNVLNGESGFLVNLTLKDFVCCVNFFKDLWYNARDKYYFYSIAARKNSLSYDWEVIVEKLKMMLISVAAKGG